MTDHELIPEAWRPVIPGSRLDRRWVHLVVPPVLLGDLAMEAAALSVPVREGREGRGEPTTLFPVDPLHWRRWLLLAAHLVVLILLAATHPRGVADELPRGTARGAPGPGRQRHPGGATPATTVPPSSSNGSTTPSPPLRRAPPDPHPAARRPPQHPAVILALLVFYATHPTMRVALRTERSVERGRQLVREHPGTTA